MTMKGISVYLVEDELLIAACLMDQLKTAGFQILGSSTRGEQCIEEITTLKQEGREPEVILMDINLRGQIDGIETARRIIKLFDCAIVFLTGQSPKEIYERSFSIKPFGCVLKPYDQEQMSMSIEIAAYQRALELENIELKKRMASLTSKQANKQ